MPPQRRSIQYPQAFELARQRFLDHPPSRVKLESECVKLFGSEDFLERRKAESENRPPIFHGR
jgi:hypothetical protein